MSDLSLVPQNAVLHKLNVMEWSHIDRLISLYSANKLDAMNALVGIGVLAGMRQHRRSLEHEFIKAVTVVEHIVNEGDK